MQRRVRCRGYSGWPRPTGEPADRTVWDAQRRFFEAAINAYFNVFRQRLKALERLDE